MKYRIPEFSHIYIPLKPNGASKLARLVLDSDDKYTLRTDEHLDLGSGYTLAVKQVDVDGKKVWLDFLNSTRTANMWMTKLSQLVQVTAHGHPSWILFREKTMLLS